MRKYITILLFSIFLAANYGCQNPGQPDDVVTPDPILRSESKLFVDVQSESPLYKIYYKEFDRSGNLLRKINYDNKGQVSSNSQYSYSDNKAVEQKEEYDNGLIKDKKIHSYEYDENGKIIKEMTFDDDGNRINTISYTYDGKGNVLTKEVVNSESGQVNFTEYKYEITNDGQIRERVTFINGSSQFDQKDTFVYDVKNNSFQIHTIDTQNQVQTVKTYIYYTDGRIKEEIISDDKGNILNRYKFEYTYY